MSKPILYIVDVFAEEKYAGNQLAVFRQAGSLTGAQMQRYAKEMNFSETTFISSEEKHNGGFDVRIFTPAEEMPFAGHPTLGTAYIIQREIIGTQVDQIALNLKVGQILVTITYRGQEADLLWMKQKPPQFGQTLDLQQMSQILGLASDEIDSRFPIQEVSTGVYFIIVPLKTLNAVRKARVDREKYFKLIEGLSAKAILVFCPETYKSENNLNVRVFADYLGVQEDPATGSANGCLAGYLVKHRFFGQNRIDLRVEQGYEIGRPSLLLLKAEEQGQEIQVQVGGKAILVAKGEWV